MFKYLLIVLALTSCSSKPKLHIFSWGDFIADQIIEDFEQKYHCQVVLDTYDSNESMYSKLKGGATGYDLIFPTHYYIAFLKHENLLNEFDPALIPNLKNINWEQLTALHFEQNNDYIPYMLSYTGIGYRTDKVQETPSSWDIFNNSHYKKRMTLLADFREVIGAALLFLGYSVNTLEQNELQAAYEVILGWKKNIAKFENEQYLNGLASQEYYICHGYSTYIAQLMKESDKISFSLPKEGGMISLDTIAMPKGGKEWELAHAFVNELLNLQAALLNMEKIQSLPPLKGLYSLLSEKEKSNPAIFPNPESVKNSQVIFDLGQNVEIYHQLWDQILESD